METIHNEFIVWIEQLGASSGFSQWLWRLFVIAVIFLLAYLVDVIFSRIIIPIVRKITDRTETIWDNHLLNEEILKNTCHLIPPILIYMVMPYALQGIPDVLSLVTKLCWIYITIASIRLICSVISSLYAISNEHEKMRNHSLKGFYQMLKLLVVCVGAVIIISILIDRNPVVILTGLGAGTAILMLVFQDTIKGLVAGIQLMANDMLRPGDWITVPKYGADGDVIEVTLTTVKVRNWDKTIVTVPPYVLVNDSFQNWRGMFDIGGRRVKRSLNIDMNTVRFCTQEEIDAYKAQPWMSDFQSTGRQEVNLYIFRHYVEHYLKNHPKVSQELIMTVRQLQPTAQGMPIELYFFSSDTGWLNYEHLQAEVFDHVLAMLHRFDLRVFQSPTGLDFQNTRL